MILRIVNRGYASITEAQRDISLAELIEINYHLDEVDEQIVRAQQEALRGIS